MTSSAFAFGLGLGTQNQQGKWLEIFFPQPLLAPPAVLIDVVANFDRNVALTPVQLGERQRALEAAGASEQAQVAGQLRTGQAPAVAVLLREDVAPANVPEGYLKLHLLSHRLVKPHGTSLEGLFGILPNVAWTSEGAIDINELTERQLAARLRGEVLEVSCVDKFPKNDQLCGALRRAHRAHRAGTPGRLPG